MAEPFRIIRRVEFSDTDAAGIVHFSAFFRYMEQAEHELLRSVGLSVIAHDDAGKISWPRGSAKCDYRSPARFEDLLEVAVSITRLGEKSITYGFAFQRGEQPIAQGEMTAICCRFPIGGQPKSMPIPESVVAKLLPFCSVGRSCGATADPRVLDPTTTSSTPQN